jgi:YegS/Rv2252/BmrU family lipid kinase
MITVIINPISGGASARDARRRVDRAKAALAAFDPGAEVLVSERRGHARELAAAAAAAGARLVMAWGGDGTMNEVGSALLGGHTPLAIIPSGSGNGLARELGIPLNAEAAIRRAIAALDRPRTIDAGEIGGRTFFNLAGVGFDAHVAARFDRAARRGFATYVRVSARALLTYRSATYRIASPLESPAERRALLVALANSPQFGSGARIAPSARVDDGRLDLVVFEEVSRLATVRAIPRLFTGTAHTIRGLTVQQVEQATIESDTPMTFHVDGEPVQGGTSLEARVLPRALKICVS